LKEDRSACLRFKSRHCDFILHLENLKDFRHMKKIAIRVFCCAVLLNLINPILSAAQPLGVIKATVKDAETGASLPGVNIRLEETNRGASTDGNGNFTITRVRPGSYKLAASILGYGTEQIEVTVEANHEVKTDLQLPPKTIELDELLVQADRSYSTASSRAVRDFDLKIRPNRSAQDVLQLAPGLVIAQHAGGGKAEQIFLRGFDADHGTDVNISVDGMPVNMVSHSHGQGYADLHFVIPDIIEEVDVYKGPYFAEYGNLATAGAVAFRTREHIDANMLRVEGGAFDTYRLTTLYQIPATGAHNNAYFAGQFYNTDGPVDSPQGFRRFNLFGKFHAHLSETAKLSFDISGFSSAWNASGQIPQRAIDNRLLDRFGSLDDREGGTTGRQNLNFMYETAGAGNSEFVIQAYASRYNFKLFSNFTFFLEDPINGDMIEQTDARQILGLNTKYKFYHNLGFNKLGLRGVGTATFGGGYRADDIDVALWHSPNRVRAEKRVDANIAERNLFLWAQEEIVFSPRLRLQLGLRGDYFTFDLEDHLETQPNNGLPHASGYAQQTILSPKANLVISPLRSFDLYANFGAGFHSNDARDVIIDQRAADLERALRRNGFNEQQISDSLAALNIDPAHRAARTLPRAVGAELGFRARLGERLNLGAAAWWLDLEREFVYVGDAGATELSGRTRRYGVDLETRLKILSWLYGDADVTISTGEARDEPENANEIPLAPRFIAAGGLTVRHPRGYEGGLRIRHIGDRPANEDNSVTALGYTVFDLSASYRIGKYQFNVIVENLTDTDWNEAQFDTESRLRNEPAPVSELHFTPGNPRNLRLGMSYSF
jgi:outer membrane receptor protein involved in Fe transport